MIRIEFLGYVASLLVLLTFCMRGMVALRVLAIASNLAFIGYAALAGIHPVLLLHAALLPMNAWRLVEIALRRGSVLDSDSASRTWPSQKRRPTVIHSQLHRQCNQQHGQYSIKPKHHV